jgi:hypothetical protein
MTKRGQPVFAAPGGFQLAQYRVQLRNGQNLVEFARGVKIMPPRRIEEQRLVWCPA